MPVVVEWPDLPDGRGAIIPKPTSGAEIALPLAHDVFRRTDGEGQGEREERTVSSGRRAPSSGGVRCQVLPGRTEWWK